MSRILDRPAQTPASDHCDQPLRPPNRIARQITGRTYLSHSQLSLFRSCPLRFRFSYIDNAPRDFVSSSLVFGSAIHACLERYFRSRLEGSPTSHEALMVTWEQSWHGQCQDAAGVPVRLNQNESVDSLRELADRMLRAFLESPFATPKGTILGVEEELRVVLHPELPDLLARVDLVIQTDSSLHVVDWKTSRSRWTEQKAAESGEQLVLYGSTVGSISRGLELPVKLHFGIVTKAKKPQVQLLPVPADTGRIIAMASSLLEVWAAIQVGNFYPAPSPMNCTTCPYRSRCPIFAGR